MKKRWIPILIVSAVCILLGGCINKGYVKEMDASAEAEQNTGENKDILKNKENVDSYVENDENLVFDKMNAVIDAIGLENAIDYREAGNNFSEDQIVFLCESPSGRYKAYGFISSEYGMQGILIDDIIDNVSNYNYFWEKWVYSTECPMLSESDDFYQVIFTICQDEDEGMKEIHFMTYDTGTMSAQGWEKL